jgi:hypothetical protein
MKKQIVKKFRLVVDTSFTYEKILIFLEDGREASIPLEWFVSLQEATTEDLNNWRLIGGGEGTHWEILDKDLLASELVS